MAMAALPYYLQLAQGRLKLHLIGTGLMVALLLPAVLWATVHHGASGAAAAWFGVNTLYLLAWTPVAHRRFAPGLHPRWLADDIAPVVLAAAACGLATWILPWPHGRLASGLQLVLIACVILLAAAAASPSARRALRMSRAKDRL
jgi:O-antigen/teichoic acid export membrane protein